MNLCCSNMPRALGQGLRMSKGAEQRCFAPRWLLERWDRREGQRRLPGEDA